MKQWVGVSLFVLFFQQRVLAQSRIIADISNFENDKGLCRACLFNNASSFKGESGNPVQCVQVPIANKKSKVQFDDVPAGTYAVFLFHDTNGNNKMDKNFIGIPKEGYGASQNKLPFAAAPTFNDNRFNVNNGTTVKLSIKIRNL
ncbi:MAG TPA: DUF2141 domain-containing protein [Flavisolibacter sp.]|nr:DUF2141 domain-containing protein [Flavisolibacter sp.]